MIFVAALKGKLTKIQRQTVLSEHVHSDLWQLWLTCDIVAIFYCVVYRSASLLSTTGPQLHFGSFHNGHRLSGSQLEHAGTTNYHLSGVTYHVRCASLNIYCFTLAFNTFAALWSWQALGQHCSVVDRIFSFLNMCLL